MKSSHLPDTELNDFVEGLLDGTAARRAEEHLRNCADCRAEAESLRFLLAGMRDLPREIRPPRDLFPEITRVAGKAETIPLDGSDRRRRALHDLRRPLAAAAVLLVVLAAAMTAWLLERRPGEPVAVISPQPALAPAADLTQVATDYEAAIRELSNTLQDRRSELDPATVRLVEENLLVIDRAIRESRAALAADPANQVLEQLVVAGYEQKLDILRRAARSTES
ncbi:MAG: zf-HC2 domain-containing protein [Gemmatimonadota bacterium]